ncbi:MAG: class I SAM-dependent methyltransferase [Dermatophilaceae bacterium]
MTAPGRAGVSQLGTNASDYSSCYYASHLGGEEEYSWDSPSWQAFFTSVSQQIIAITSPARVLDVGCAKGLLVQALVGAGVDAFGFDISHTAIAGAAQEISDRLSVATAVDPIAGRYDLITCVEVVEHMSAEDANRAIANMCAATDLVLFSSGPGDFAEPTHVNVRPPADWAAIFAEHAFFRRTDVDLGFLTPWAVLFERVDLDVRALTHRYEAYAYPLRIEVVDKRAALLEAHRTISELHESGQRPGGAAAPAVEPATAEPTYTVDWGEPPPEPEAALAQNAALRQENLELHHRLLVSRDHAIGAEAAAAAANTKRAAAESAAARAQGELNDLVLAAGAQTKAFENENASLRREAASFKAEADLLTEEIRQIKASRRWRVGGWVAQPALVAKRMAGRR